MEITRSIAEFVVRTSYADLPTETVTQTKRAVLDTLGVMIAGSTEPCARIAADVVRADEGRAVATVVGQGFSAPARAAALVNGTAAHALDYDDVTTSMRGHPSPPLLPALLAVGEETGASGRAMIEAFVLGFEVQCKVGRGLGPSHYPHGWHATSTLGTLGATVLAAKLYGLDVDTTRLALGIAASMSSGSRQNFGTMTKPLHPGLAAASGVLAAKLAAGGFTADEEILETPLGFLNLFSPAKDARPELVLPELGTSWDIVSPGIGVKKYPCCYNTHRALDAILELRDERGFDEQTVESIRVIVPKAGSQPLIHPRPTTGLEGKFSMHYCMATAVIDGSPVLDTFLDSSVRRDGAQTLLRRVEMVESEESAPVGGGFADVSVTLRGGDTVRKRIDEPRGGPERPLSWDELVVKFRDCATRVLDGDSIERSLAAIRSLEDLPRTSDLTRLVSGQRQPATV